jgi:hypothetical protein
MDAKELLIKLVSANDEEEVENIIWNNPILNSNRNWQPYGDNETNFNTILNQQGRSVQALVE